MKKSLKVFWQLAVVASLLLPAALLAAESKIPAGKWTISTGGDNSATSNYCATELQELLAHRIGTKLPVVKDKNLPSGPVILLDKTDPKLDWQAFRIVRKKDVIRIIGGSPVGTLFGVYEFLQRYCDVWTVAPGVVYAPKGQPLVFGDLDLTMKPAIIKRELYHAGYYNTLKKARENWIKFNYRNRLSHYPAIFVPYTDTQYNVSYTRFKACHTFYDYISPEEYGKTHPEYFSMDPSGVRNMRKNAGGQLCLSNPDVEKIVTSALLDTIAKDRKKYGARSPRVYDFSQLDNTNYICCCPECKKIIAKYGNVDSGLMVWFVNKVIRTVKKKYPDVIFRTFAYVSTEKLPSGITVDDNILIQLCDLYSQSNHTLPLTHPVNRKRKELVEGWGKIAKNMMIWDYILQSGNQPVVPIDAIVPDVRFFISCNVKWIFMESEIRIANPSAFEHLKNFLIAQIYFNPDQDLEKLIDVYCRGYFGAAHQEMRDYLNFLRKSQNEKPTADMHAWHLRELKHFNLDFLRRCRAMIQKAMAVNKDPVIALRLLCERNVIDNALTRMLAAYPKFAAERKALLSELLDNRLKVLRAYGLEAGRLKQFEADIRLPIEESMLVFTDIPEELKKMPPGSIRFLGPSRQSAGGFNGRYVKDPDSKYRRVLMWTHPNQAKFTKTIGCGVYDQQWKKSVGGVVTAPSDEKYHWYRIVRFSMGPSTICWALNWHAGFNLRGFFIVSDGVKAEDNPNLYDLWVSIKFQGPAYKKDSKKENGIFFERAMLVPIAKKYGNYTEPKTNVRRSAPPQSAVPFTGKLPEEMAGIPKEGILDVSAFIYGPKKMDDPESARGKAAVFTPAKNTKNYGGFSMGIYTKNPKQVVGYSLVKPKDEKYHWYKVSRRNNDLVFPGGSYNTQLYMANWTIGAWMPANVKGKFDCWASVKAQGPLYVPGSTKENKLFLDAVLLVPLK